MDIDVRHVSVTFPASTGDVRVLRDVSLTFYEGCITALVGESGSGKSILGEAAMGFLAPGAEVAGDILYEGQNLLTMTEEERNAIRGRHLGWIAQDPISAMDPLIRVGKQVTEAVRYFFHRSETDEREKGKRQLARYGLQDPAQVYASYPHELSGGMAQRAMAAMMTMPQPEWLIADEPTKGLDAFVRNQVAHMFVKLREEGTGIILITHDLKLAEHLADYVAVLYAGEVLEFGTKAEVFDSPAHPYTQGLLAAAPDKGLHPIPGNPPSLSALPTGCIFQNRCLRYVAGLCDRTQKRVAVSGSHWVRCGREGP